MNSRENCGQTLDYNRVRDNMVVVEVASEKSCTGSEGEQVKGQVRGL
jgi:hypothetical protein